MISGLVLVVDRFGRVRERPMLSVSSVKCGEDGPPNNLLGVEREYIIRVWVWVPYLSPGTRYSTLPVRVTTAGRDTNVIPDPNPNPINQRMGSQD